MLALGNLFLVTLSYEEDVSLLSSVAYFKPVYFSFTKKFVSFSSCSFIGSPCQFWVDRRSLHTQGIACKACKSILRHNIQLPTDSEDRSIECDNYGVVQHMNATYPLRSISMTWPVYLYEDFDGKMTQWPVLSRALSGPLDTFSGSYHNSLITLSSSLWRRDVCFWRFACCTELMRFWWSF